MESAVLEELDVSAWSTAELDQINAQFRDRPAEELLDWATAAFGDRIALTCSFSGPSGMVLLDMVARLKRATPVIFLDTDLLFPETYALVETVTQRYGVAIERRRPALTLDEQARQHGPRLYDRDPDRCCAIRKVAPLAEVLRPYDAWISGIRRDQSATRAATELVQWNARHGLLKLNPLAFWTEREVWSYIFAHEVPYNPLLDRGYPSIGCMPCTRTASGGDARAGRWAGSVKTECGIHL
jgi:phosphoadenosine phosphosulfate reductase